MQKNTVVLALLAATLLGSGSALAGCRFSWHHYGDSAIRDRVAQSIGTHISDEYCAKFNAGHEIVLQFHSYQMKNSQCVGHAIAAIRKRNSDVLPVQNFSSVVTDGKCNTFGQANDLAAEASLSAVDNLMSELSTYKVSR